MENESTDPDIVRFLLTHWTPTKNKAIWDAACGGGELARQLKRAGYAVVASDIADFSYGDSRVDFLKAKTRAGDILIVDPPASLAADFVWHALRLGITEMAVVMPRSLWTPRHKIFNRSRPALVMPFSENAMWVVWKPGSGDTKIIPLPGLVSNEK